MSLDTIPTDLVDAPNAPLFDLLRIIALTQLSIPPSLDLGLGSGIEDTLRAKETAIEIRG